MKWDYLIQECSKLERLSRDYSPLWDPTVSEGSGPCLQHFRLGRKGLTVTNILVYYDKEFIAAYSGANVIKLFTVISYDIS
jgi:hypothetical protein